MKRLILQGSGWICLSVLVAPLGGCDVIQGLQPATLQTGGNVTSAGGTGGIGGITTTDSGTGGSVGTGGVLTCQPGTSIDCYTGIPDTTNGTAKCHGGTRSCKEDGSGYEDACEGEQTPQPETCASADDEDCDGHDCAIWAHVFGDNSEQTPLDIAVDKQGNAYVVGKFKGALPLSDPALVTAGGYDLFLAKFSPLGDVLWSKRFGDAQEQEYVQVVTDPEGNVVIGGSFEGILNLGGQNLMAQAGDVYLAKFDAAGDHLWSKRFGTADNQGLISLQSDDDGNLLITGSFRGVLDVGSGAMTATCCDFDVYVAKLDSSGDAIWSSRFGDEAGQFVSASVVDSAGSVFVSGDFSGHLDFGGGDLASVGAKSGYTVRLDGNGGYDWATKQVNASLSFGASVGGGLGTLVLAGSLAGSVDFGGPPIMGDGSGVDLFLAKLKPGGFHDWSKVLVTTGSSHFVSGLASDSGMNVIVTSWGNGTVDFGGGPLGVTNADSVFLAKLNSAGAHVWSRRFPGRSSVVATAPNGDIVVAARVSGTIDVGTGPLPTNGQDLLVARFAP